MKDIKNIRNIALFGHGKCGKTSLAEAMLFTAGKTKRLGKVDDGTSVMDFEPEEVNRNMTISSSFNNYSWKKNQTFIIDTPGDDNFINDAKFATRVADNAVFIVGAVLGVKYQTIKIAEYVKEAGLPTLICINKMDRERANFDKTIAEIKAQVPLEAAVCFLPIGSEENFKGVVDIIHGKAYAFDNSGKVKETEIPGDMADAIEAAREELMEQVAETDDDLIEKFLEEGELTSAELIEGLRNGLKAGKISPVIPCSATGNLGTELILNAINDLLCSPADRPAQVGTKPDSDDLVELKPSADAPFSALVFKTMADPYAGQLTILRVFSGSLSGDTFFNASKKQSEKFSQLFIMEGKEAVPVDDAGPGMIVAIAKLKDTFTGDSLCSQNNPVLFDALTPIEPVMSFAVTTSKKEDEDKLFASISKMLEEDPTLRLTRGLQTKEILLSGVGQMHLVILGEKIKRKYGVELELHVPKVPYKEAIKGKARVQGKHKKQSGGRGQFADSWIEMEPLPRGGGFEFADKIVGGAIPKQYIPAVEKGVVEAMEKGVIAGYPMIDVKVALVDGSFHAVDSSEMAFKISGSLAFKKAAQEANPVLLEPIMNVAIRIPKDCVGDVIGDLNSRRGKVMGMDSEIKGEIVTAQIPMAEILEYAPNLTSITGGRGTFSSEFSHYEELPNHISDKVIADSNKEE
ncbi:MAG: elongation factor G [Desulfobulbaceae bacterium]|uniref:Elongation factor G n=1 Tax=Candidatus Desulfobia pelagia TaxID=2841692 RepID=A0A8J6NDX1_9BACT|nr:elongation factor G [Candidatus Desulfobia pelagia]